MPIQHPRLVIYARIGATSVTIGRKKNAGIGEVNGDIAAKEGPKRSGTSVGVIAAEWVPGLREVSGHCRPVHGPVPQLWWITLSVAELVGDGSFV